MQAGTHRNRVRVRVRSFVDGHTLQFVSEGEARIMCGERANGSEMLGQDGKPLEAVARRLSRLKAPLTDIKLLAPAKAERPSNCSLSQVEMRNNAFNEGFSAIAKTANDAKMVHIVRPAINDAKKNHLTRAASLYLSWPAFCWLLLGQGLLH
jgi:hypothetical protein